MKQASNNISIEAAIFMYQGFLLETEGITLQEMWDCDIEYCQQHQCRDYIAKLYGSPLTEQQYNQMCNIRVAYIK
jgi:hypothetical protein